MAAIIRDIVIEVGAVWHSPVRLTVQATGANYPLAGAKARMQIRDLDGVLLVDLSTENGRLVIDEATSIIDRRIGATATAGIVVEKGRYDMEIIPNGDPDLAWKLYRGKVKFIGDGTHD